MTNNEIKRMGELKTIIDKATKELEALKAKAREEANGGELVFPTCGGVTVVARKVASPYVKPDMDACKAKAPKTYERIMALYSKTVTPGKARVDVLISK